MEVTAGLPFVARRNRDLAAEIARAAAFRSALRQLMARTEVVTAKADLTPQRYNLLLMIKASPGETSTVSELVKSLKLQQTAVTELVKRAEEAGLLTRETSPADGRVYLLRLSREGERRLMRAFVALRKDREEIARSLAEVNARLREAVRADRR
jgi:DNA-binding MarR family transcriptional regulator